MNTPLPAGAPPHQVPPKPRLPRVVVVDDDPAICRLVALVLEGEALDLVPCGSVEQARAALRSGPVHLLLTDLMMPGESGHDLLRQLQSDPDLPRPAHVAVFSAGLDASTREGLAALGVWRQLAKPVSIHHLLDTVHEALSGTGSPTVAAPAALPVRSADTPGPQGGSEQPSRDSAAPDQAEAVSLYFGGDSALFQAYRQACLPLFADDLALGDAALAKGDVAALRRLGHSLKSVWRTLGETSAAQAAQALDSAAQATAAPKPVASPTVEPGTPGLNPVIEAAWAQTRQHLARLSRRLPEGG